MKQKLPKLENESHGEYQKRVQEIEKARAEKRHARRKATLAFFESIKRGEIEYTHNNHPLNSKGRIVQLKDKNHQRG